jgi:formylmethanofuran dehydrogenase subunit D
VIFYLAFAFDADQIFGVIISAADIVSKFYSQWTENKMSENNKTTGNSRFKGSPVQSAPTDAEHQMVAAVLSPER